MPLSKHGELRARKRFGIPKKTAEKLAIEAWDQGHHIKVFTGYFKKYLMYQARTYRCVVRVHKGNLFFFDHEGILITCWPIPNQYRKNYKDRIEHVANS